MGKESCGLLFNSADFGHSANSTETAILWIIRTNGIILQRISPGIGTAVAVIVFILLVILTGLWARDRKKLRSNELKAESLRSALQQKESTLITCNTEREWLIGEINHRVKNNLQVISSLLSNQSAYLTNENAQETIRTSQRRLYAISLAYHSMYLSAHLSKVNLRQYVGDLLGYLKDEYQMNEGIKLEADITEVSLGIQTIIPLGLIIYEAVSNAIKFAFPNNDGGKITIGVTQPDKKNLVLLISDNGVGLPPAFDPRQSKSMGISLIIGLSRQLGGECELTDGQGLSLILTFLSAEQEKFN